MLPPPRATMMTSTSSRSASREMAAAISAEAPSPCTRVGERSTRTRAPPRDRVCSMSWRTAPVGDVTTPTVRTMHGQRPLPLLGEESLGRKARLECFERALKIPHTHEIEGIDVQRVAALRREDADAPGGHDAQPELGLDRHAVLVAGPQDRVERRSRVLEREVRVAVRGLRDFRNLAHDAHGGEAGLEAPADPAGQFGDRDRRSRIVPARRGRRNGGLGRELRRTRPEARTRSIGGAPEAAFPERWAAWGRRRAPCRHR